MNFIPSLSINLKICAIFFQTYSESYCRNKTFYLKDCCLNANFSEFIVNAELIALIKVLDMFLRQLFEYWRIRANLELYHAEPFDL